MQSDLGYLPSQALALSSKQIANGVVMIGKCRLIQWGLLNRFKAKVRRDAAVRDSESDRQECGFAK